ncbi:hypothetical protein CO038_00330 [Candidatus Pacearchaeota archaeon CG_4_9_14_0_2_um_filter_39_13]|nr:hypothetical protein [Candidatus Pacearchaeota archaeon]OIO44014.1 MAG: hypothetical protein AUJ64_00925 [Candidatus Pacearchaeota archaeon CG1_02_39_14]PJC45120.1 MAG: hypothetical protein CO038_00330 [Candidatus Pacearchaeota archaeon CG_4_9_14_0_2_um_filter_39_13]
MELWQIATISATSLAIILSLILFLSRFRISIKLFHPLIMIVLIFSTGFCMRLSESQRVVDLGYFFTDLSFLFTYILFTATLILGQKKYWRVT